MTGHFGIAFAPCSLAALATDPKQLSADEAFRFSCEAPDDQS